MDRTPAGNALSLDSSHPSSLLPGVQLSYPPTHTECSTGACWLYTGCMHLLNNCDRFFVQKPCNTSMFRWTGPSPLETVGRSNVLFPEGQRPPKPPEAHCSVLQKQRGLTGKSRISSS